jgi:uncharacterized membrane protein HdeD (DUF308 family)
MTEDIESKLSKAYLGEKRFKENWLSFFILGIILVILGVMAIVGVNFVTLTSIVFFGTLLTVGGLLQILYAFWARKEQGFSQTILSGIFYSTVGVIMLTHPTVGAIAVTLLLASFYIVSGIFKIIASLATPMIQWKWLLISGVISLLLGIYIWSEWSSLSLWIIGLFIGIDLIFVGWFWIMLSLTARNLPTKQ